jgi:RNA polymerase sigma factor (sigma-70 family)
MRGTGTNASALVVAAQAGDRRALDDLLRAYVPFVYTIARRALISHSDADDVVQETMLRAVRDLPELHSPASFRAWLAAIAVRQVSTCLRRGQLAAAQTTSLEDLTGSADAAADIENLTMLEVGLSDQRRQVAYASRWLDADDRALLSLWWLEVAGQLTRAELSDALGVTIAHAGVRIQRMRGQLELSRSLVAALDALPRCPQLDMAIEDWDAVPSELWRKRIARHTRSCARCTAAAGESVPTDRLLVGFALLPAPAALTAALISKLSTGGTAVKVATVRIAVASGGAGMKAGIVSQVARAILAHPVVAAVVTGAIIAGAALTSATLPTAPERPVIGAPTTAPVALPATVIVPRPTRAPRTSSVPASPSPTPVRTLAAGPISLESVSQAGTYVYVANTYGVLTTVDTSSPSNVRQAATFEAVAGLADPACFSFRLADGQYLRHSSWKLRSYPPSSADTLFNVDATFCPHPGAVAGSISLTSYNYPNAFLHRRGTDLWVDEDDGSAAFGADSSFRVCSPLQA